MARFPGSAGSTETLKGSVFQALSRRLKKQQGPLHPLHVGDTWREPPAPAQSQALLTSEHPGLHAYALPQGEPALLEAIEERLARAGGAVPRERIQVCSGATVGLSLTAQALLDPGDELLLPSPYWPLIRGVISSRGVRPVEVPLWTRLDEPSFDLEDALESAISERTTALYLNTPHNPTGRVMSDEQLAAVARVAARHELWVLADQVYEELWYGEPPPTAPWLRPDMRERCVAVHSLSKSHGLAGARVGWIHGPAAIMNVIRRVQTYQVYCAARPMQVAGARALASGDDWLAEAKAGYERCSHLAAEALGLPAPRGGNFLFFDARPWLAGGDDALPFLERCLDEGVVLTPGASCGEDYRSWVRLCFTSVPEDQLTLALEALRRVTR